MGEIFTNIWDALCSDPAEAERMKKWSNNKMLKEKLKEVLDRYMESVYQSVDTADTTDVLEILLEELYGEDIWDYLDDLAYAKFRGKPLVLPKFLADETEDGKVYEINPEGIAPDKQCQCCNGDDTDWRGINTKYLLLRCGFCRDGGQDW